MARKDLLKRAFHNSFMRKSVADLRSMATNRASPQPRCSSSSANHATQFESTAAASKKNNTALMPETSTSSSSNSADPVAGEGRHTDSVTDSINRATKNGQIDRACDDHASIWSRHVHDTMYTTIAEGREQANQNDSRSKQEVHSGTKRQSEDGDLSTYADLLFAAEEIAASHLDTIETTLAILESIGELSPYVERLKREMLQKKRTCCDSLEKLLQSRITLEASEMHL